MTSRLESILEKKKISPVTRCRVLIVDDSLVMRSYLRRNLLRIDSVEIVGTAGHGESALQFIKSNEVDLIILDLEMPLMDGITAIPKILEYKPDMDILIASALTMNDAGLALEALKLGAKDYITKPSSESVQVFEDTLEQKVKTFAKGIIAKRNRLAQAAPQIMMKGLKEYTLQPCKSMAFNPDVIVIGSSTGGPQALSDLLRNSRAYVNKPILVAQHMPPMFTTMLAKSLSRESGLVCKEAEEGEEITSGVVYLAPGNFHMFLKNNRGVVQIGLNQEAPENLCRPSVNPLFRSAGEIYGSSVLAIILTGMGGDGLEGARELVEKGGALIAQDEASSVVWGMPKVVLEAGLCSEILPLQEIRERIKTIMVMSHLRGKG